jgi:hypothetical protein
MHAKWLIVSLAVLSCGNCSPPGTVTTGPASELLSYYVRGVQLGMTAGDLKRLDVQFRPYDGYLLSLDPPKDGFESAMVKNDQAFTEMEPASDDRVAEVMLTGKQPHYRQIRGRLARTFGSSANVVGCLQASNSVRAEIEVWTDRQASVEFTYPMGPGAAQPTLRFLLGKWDPQRYGQRHTPGPCR